MTERLSLFLGVCAAVQYAHQNLIIHRDLKPANILVTGEGAIKLLDFGIAKLLADEADTTKRVVTRFQPRTLAYAAPEQLANRAVSTSSDVYSLGVVLYRLLTGHHPYRLDGLSATEAEKVVSEQEPVRPSAAALRRDGEEGDEDLSAWGRRLRGDLDRILLKALAKDPSHRYPTVDALAEDIGRHLMGQPVAAQPPTWRYRAGKFLGRHRVGTVAALLVALAAAGALGGIAWQARRAEGEAARATAVAELLTSIFSDANPYEGADREMSLLGLLDRGYARVRDQVTDPGIRADLFSALAKAYGGQGRYETAVRLLQQALTERSRVLGPDDPGLAPSVLALGGALRDLGRYDDAQEYLDRALTLVERGQGRDSADGSDALLALGGLHEDRGDFAGAETYYREVLRIRRRLAAGPDFRVAVALNALSGAVDCQGRHGEGLDLLGEALSIARDTVGEESPFTASMRTTWGCGSTRRVDSGKPPSSIAGPSRSRRRAWGRTRRGRRMPTPTLARC